MQACTECWSYVGSYHHSTPLSLSLVFSLCLSLSLSISFFLFFLSLFGIMRFSWLVLLSAIPSLDFCFRYLTAPE